LNISRERLTLILTLVLGVILASACGPSAADATPTLDIAVIQTQAVATFAADLTQTALAMPTETPTPTMSPTPTATETPEQTSTPQPTIGSLPTSSCFSMAFVADVTIPDNTSMTPGQAFTKTWRVRNNGSCAWEVGFKLRFTGGNALGGSDLTLDKAVNSGGETELSVPMTAPSTSGSFRSNWRMSTATGTYFGDEIYVLIVVGGSTATAPAATATNTPTPTETAVP
jgi:hypothetical protein